MTTEHKLRFYTLAKEFTPVIRRGRPPIISPDSPDDGSPSLPPTDLNNTFAAAIAPSRQPDNSDNDDEQSSLGTTQSVSSSDDDTDYGINAMTTVQRKEITAPMTRVIPVAEPVTNIELQSFRKEVANALFTQKTRGVKTGHAFFKLSTIISTRLNGFEQHFFNCEPFLKLPFAIA